MTDEHKKKVKIVKKEEISTIKDAPPVSSSHDHTMMAGGVNDLSNVRPGGASCVPHGIYQSSGSHYEKDSNFEDFSQFLYGELNEVEKEKKEKKKKEKKILPIKKSELDKIKECDTLKKCHIYILSKNKRYSLFDTFLVLFDNILKIVPVVIFSSLPVLLITNFGSVISINLIGAVYGLMLSSIPISIILRWIFKNESMAIEQYYSLIKKREKEIIA